MVFKKVEWKNESLSQERERKERDFTLEIEEIINKNGDTLTKCVAIYFYKKV